MRGPWTRLRAARGLLAALMPALLAPALASAAGLTLDERIACQRAVEQVYWRHRTPAAPGAARVPFDQAVPAALLRRRAEDVLHKSAVLAADWDAPITAAQLQAELDRMAAATQAPAVLAELFAALGHDAERAAECLARPQLADRLLRSHFAGDERLQGPVRRQAQAGLAGGRLAGAALDTVTWVRGRPSPLPAGARPMPPQVFEQHAQALRRREGGAGGLPALGRWGRLHEDEHQLYAVAIDVLDADQVRLRTARWPKTGFDAWWQGRRPQAASALPVLHARYRLPTLAAADLCRDDSWKPTLAGLDPRYEHSAVWTGAEMVVWGGMEAVGFVYNDGARYNPATDSWAPVSDLGAPHARHAHQAVWTGREMLVFGGGGNSRSGGRYDPVTDTWRPMTETGAPLGQQSAAHVWTGREFIVWGGHDGVPTNAGARYDPQADRWQALPPAPLAARAWMPAVWTGREMLVWSGYDVSRGQLYADGARLDPAAGTWKPMATSGAPAATLYHSAVWSGSEMLVWGGSSGEAGQGRYDPATDSWRSLTTAGAPPVRYLHGAVWTGQEMLVHGGWPSNAPGGRYDPATDTWRLMATRNAAVGGQAGTMVWSGREALVWGGLDESFRFHNDGARYDPAADRWRPMNRMHVPDPAGMVASQWTGAEMILWGGSYASGPAGSRYDPATDSWSQIATRGQPVPRGGATAVWTGQEILFWGAGPGDPFTEDSGGRYDPAADRWQPISRRNAPYVTLGHTAVWTGREMITYGGISSIEGARRYDPAADRWTAATMIGDPGHRDHHGAVWTGTEMIVWGGSIDAGSTPTGGRYDPATNRWTALPVLTSPQARMWPVSVWTGREAIFWGGYDQLFQVVFGDGGRFDPATGRWGRTRLDGAPSPRIGQGVWTGRELLVWGGDDDRSGGRYDPATDAWQPTTLLRAPKNPWGGNWSTAWTGTRMVVWGGSQPTQKGALYCASGVSNGAPQAAADAVVARSGRPLVVGVAAGVLRNDADPNGDVLNARLLSGPAHGSVQLNANGSFTYRSAAGYRGVDSFQYVANDDLADSAPAVVTVDVR